MAQSLPKRSCSMASRTKGHIGLRNRKLKNCTSISQTNCGTRLTKGSSALLGRNLNGNSERRAFNEGRLIAPSVDRLGRRLHDLVGPLSELRALKAKGPRQNLSANPKRVD